MNYNQIASYMGAIVSNSHARPGGARTARSEGYRSVDSLTQWLINGAERFDRQHGYDYIDQIHERRAEARAFYGVLEERDDVIEYEDESRDEWDGIEYRDDGSSTVWLSGDLPAVEFPPDIEPESRAELLPRVVTAMTVRWNTPLPAIDDRGRHCYVRYTRHSLDHLFDDPEQRSVPVLMGHGRPGDGLRAVTEPVGQLIRIYDNGEGLVTTTLYGDDPTARAVVALVEDQVLEHYSARSRVIESRDSGEEYNGLPLIDILEARLVEVGPCTRSDAGDPRALILTANGQPIEERAADVARIEYRSQDAAAERAGVAMVRGWLGSR